MVRNASAVSQLDAVLPKAVAAGTVTSNPLNSTAKVFLSQKRYQKISTNKSTTKVTTKDATSTKKSKIQRAQGMLYGLSTLKRLGNVRVSVLAAHTTVRSNFRLGPLQLRVNKFNGSSTSAATGKIAAAPVKSASATTTEMMGRINLRIVKGAATLHSIKVQQPRQQQSSNQKTRDNVTAQQKAAAAARSHQARLAAVVHELLTDAVRSMLQPPPPSTQKTSEGDA